MIGQRIKKLRLKKNMTLSELATLSNISKSYLSYMERDLKNNPSLEVIKKISTPLNTSVHYLLTGEEEDVLHFLLQRFFLSLSASHPFQDDVGPVPPNAQKFAPWDFIPRVSLHLQAHLFKAASKINHLIFWVRDKAVSNSGLQNPPLIGCEFLLEGAPHS